MKKLIALSCFCCGIFVSAQKQESNLLAENDANSSAAVVAKTVTYSDHLIAARSFEMPPVENFDDIEGFVIMNKLIPVPEKGNGYTIEKLTHSKAFLNPKAKSVLEEISKRFFEEYNKTITVTSLTRSEESQSRLRRVNSNAARGDSAHNYGAAFDLSFTKFNDKYSYNKIDRENLESILKEMQNNGEIYYIKEYKQHCFHVTVRNTNQSSSTVL